jgi:hypothetical protein
MANKNIYLVTQVQQGSIAEPFACSNFKAALAMATDVGKISQPNVAYKTGLRRIQRDGYLALYCLTRTTSDVEASVKGYMSIEIITYYK